MRRAWKAGWILLLIGFGVFFGIDQAAKQQGENPAAVHRSYWPESGGAKSGESAGPARREEGGNREEGGGGADNSGRTAAEPSRTEAAGGSAIPAGRGETGAAPVGRSPQAAAVRPVPVGIGTSEAAWGEPTSVTNRSSDSFLNRLGNKLGEAVRALFSTVIGWIVNLFNRLLG